MAKILIVDDNAVNRDLLTTLLVHKGHDIQEAADGAEALALARATRPDLIVTDILMPTMDGYEFVRQLRLDPAIAATAVIFCTADYHGREAQKLAKSCGVANILIKPCEPQTVLDTVASALGLAMLSTMDAPPTEFGRDHLRLLTDKLSQKTVELETVNQRLTALIESSLQFAAEAHPPQLLEKVCRAARTLIGANFCAVAAGGADSDVPAHFFTGGIGVTVSRAIGVPPLRQGALGAMLKRRRAWRVANAAGVPVLGLPAGFPTLRGLLAAPISSLRHTYGWVCLGGKVGDGEFTDTDERLLTLLCEQVGRMYENVTLLAKAQNDAVALEREANERRLAQGNLQAQLERLGLLHQITRAIGERQDLRSIFQVVLGSLEADLSIDLGCICLYEAEQRTLTVTAIGSRCRALATEVAMTEQTRFQTDASGLATCMQGRLVYEPDVALARFDLPQRLAASGLRSLVAAPLLAESTVFGVLIAARRQVDSFTSGDCEFLKQLSEHVALAAHQAQLYGALQRAYEDLRHSQQAVMQQERLRALGQMASGVAHDINNAISPVMLYTESLLEQERGLSERARSHLKIIQRAVDGVAQTVARMREFYRQREQQLVPMPVNLNRVVEQVVEFTQARWRDQPQQRGIVIDLRKQLDPDLPDIAGMETEIRDALTNLLFNAVDAMPEGGVLTLRTYRSPADAQSAGESVPLDTVNVEVADSGEGMDEETRRRCLEPFFTTKGEQGTGLGLAMVYGTAQRHGAELQVDSAPGKGTTLRLKFQTARTTTGNATWMPVQLPMPSLPILVVDDDPLLIESLRDTLQSDGHAIAVADGGQCGIDTFIAAAQRGEPFALVITDLGMPYVDGRKVAAAVKARSPATPVIMLTGWGQRLTADNEIPPHVDRMLSKPPKLNELRRALHELVLMRQLETGNVRNTMTPAAPAARR
jgi:signal transduction histidine kinase/DNA-binding response OmpR family regulator